MHNKKKFDSNLSQQNIKYFFPLITHCDDYTVFTKNGELIQLVEIKGLNSSNTPSDFSALRSKVCKGILNNSKSNNFAFWIQTVRDKHSLNYRTNCSNIFAQELSDVWNMKHHWNDRYINTIYISIIYRPADLTINDFNSFVNTLFCGTLQKFHNNYLREAIKVVSHLTDNLIHSLNDYDCQKLGVISNREIGNHESIEEENKYYSQILSYYKYLITGQYKLVELNEFSDTNEISSFSYLLGNNMIEVSDNEIKNYTSVLSIKEYNNLNLEDLDYLLSIPSQMITTEVIFFIDPNVNDKERKYLQYILKVSGDQKLLQLKNNNKSSMQNTIIQQRYCNRSVNITINANSIKDLERDISMLSDKLSKLGVVHVREDIMLEHSFWSKIPGNFKFLCRPDKIVEDNICGLTTLHNSFVGYKKTVWGDCITMLRSESGLPFFFSFHGSSNIGNTTIYSGKNTGKDQVMNFIISESIKHNPTLLHLGPNNHSEVFIKSLGGQWVNTEQFYNPLLIMRKEQNAYILLEFFKIICNHYEEPLKEIHIQVLQHLIYYIFQLPPEQCNITFVYNNFDFGAVKLEESDDSEIQNSTAGLEIKNLISVLMNDKYNGKFDTNNYLELAAGDIVGIDLSFFSEKYFASKYMPLDDKKLFQYYKDLRQHKNICAAYVFTLCESIINHQRGYKHILAISSLVNIIGHKVFAILYKDISDLINSNSGIILANTDIENYNLCDPQTWESVLDNTNTQILMPMDLGDKVVAKCLNLTSQELNRIVKFTVNSRLMMLKQNGNQAVVELNLGSLPQLLRILDCDAQSVELFNKTQKDYGGDMAKVLPIFYHSLK